MIRKISVLLLSGVLGLGGELWVNAIRDPGAELGLGDWGTDVYETPAGAADSARVSCHDSTRAYEGSYSFLTDTDIPPGLSSISCWVVCYQSLKVPKVVKDIDSCFWIAYLDEAGSSGMLWKFYTVFRSSTKQIRWFSGAGTEGVNDTACVLKIPLPDSGKWTEYGVDLYDTWVNTAGWSTLDTISQVALYSSASGDPYWIGQEVSWDNIVLRCIAYYDYAAESIDSDELADKTYTPIVTFTNEGKKADKDGWVYAEILEGTILLYKDSLAASIPSETSEQFTFSQWTVPHDGSYTLRVYPILEFDEYSADDTLEQTLTGIGITEAPSKTDEVTIRFTPIGISFTLSPRVEGKLAIYDASGREVYAEPVKPSTSELTWSTRKVPSGLYFYKLSSPGKVFSGKLVVIH